MLFPCGSILSDGSAAAALRSQGISIYQALQNNDAYHALQATGGLLITGPTGTNVNDIAVGLLHNRGKGGTAFHD